MRIIKEALERFREWREKFKYRTVRTEMVTVKWPDKENTSEAVIIFQENGFGERRLESEGCLLPLPIEHHPYWLGVAVPWREGVE